MGVLNGVWDFAILSATFFNANVTFKSKLNIARSPIPDYRIVIASTVLLAPDVSDTSTRQICLISTYTSCSKIAMKQAFSVDSLSTIANVSILL